jgi:hypothetical protein
MNSSHECQVGLPDYAKLCVAAVRVYVRYNHESGIDLLENAYHDGACNTMKRIYGLVNLHDERSFSEFLQIDVVSILDQIAYSHIVVRDATIRTFSVSSRLVVGRQRMISEILVHLTSN